MAGAKFLHFETVFGPMWDHVLDRCRSNGDPRWTSPNKTIHIQLNFRQQNFNMHASSPNPNHLFDPFFLSTDVFCEYFAMYLASGCATVSPASSRMCQLWCIALCWRGAEQRVKAADGAATGLRLPTARLSAARLRTHIRA